MSWRHWWNIQVSMPSKQLDIDWTSGYFLCIKWGDCLWTIYSFLCNTLKENDFGVRTPSWPMSFLSNMDMTEKVWNYETNF